MQLAHTPGNISTNELEIPSAEQYTQSLSLGRGHVNKTVLHAIIAFLLNLFLLVVGYQQHGYSGKCDHANTGLLVDARISLSNYLWKVHVAILLV